LFDQIVHLPVRRKVLVIRFSSIGDIVLTSPVIRCLHEQLDAEVYVITKDAFAGIYRNNPHVHKVITIRSKVSEAEAELKAQPFDFVADLHHNLRSMQVKRICNAPSASFPKLNVQKFIYVKLGINRMPDVHIVDRYFEAVLPLGVKNDGRGLDYFIAEKNNVALSSLPALHQRGYIAVTAGAKFATKEMPHDLIVGVIRRLNRPVVLLGGKDEIPKGEKIAAACGDLVFNACGKYNLDQSASLVQQSEMVIAHDTGLMHIAAAFRKKIYSVWGNTIPGFGMYPYLPAEGSRMIEVKGLRCRPCSKLGYAECPLGHFRCMNDISVSAFDDAAPNS
jgi:ADP-heptose:LPS heptosyltransferase